MQHPASWFRTASVLMLLVPGVAATDAAARFPLAGTVDSQGVVTLDGALHGLASTEGFVFASNWKNGSAEARLSARGAHVRVINNPIHYTTTDRDGPAGGSDVPVPLPERVEEEFDFDGVLSIRSRQAVASIQIRPLGSASMEVVLNETGPQRLEMPDARWYVPSFASGSPHGAFFSGRLHRETPGDALFQGACLAAVYGADVTFGVGSKAKVIHAGLHPAENGVLSDPWRYATTGVFDRITVLVSIPDAQVVLNGSSPGLWNKLVSSFRGQFDGDIAFTNVQEATVDERFLDERLGLVQAIGTFDLEGSYGSAESHWALDGTASFLAIDGQGVAGRRVSQDVLLLGAGLGVFGWLTLAFTQFGKDLRFLLWGHNKQAQPLAHPHRRRILELVTAQPGISAMQLTRTLGIRRPSLEFHASVLQRADYIERYRYANRDHFAPLAHMGTTSMQARQRALLACQTHPLRARILACLDMAIPRGYGDLVDALSASGLVPGRTLLGYHVRLMERDGVIARASLTRPVTWVLAGSLPPSFGHVPETAHPSSLLHGVQATRGRQETSGSSR